MGGAKREMEEADSRGYWSVEGDVCKECVIDGDLLVLHASRCAQGSCDFCDNEDVEVAPAEVIQERIMMCLGQSYEQIDNAGVPYNGQEGGYFVSPDSGDDIVSNDVAGAVSDVFLDALAEAASDYAWVKSDWALLHPLDRLKGGWDGFCHTVRHHLRFSFVFEPESDEGHPDSTSPLGTLREISGIIDSLNLIHVIPAGTELYRVRVNSSKRFLGIDNLGAPPHQYAKANRMSPAGISMFYGALDFETAVKETWDAKQAAICSKGTFRTKRDIRTIDFTRLPEIPGYWSNPGRDPLAILRFMHELVKDFSRPIDRNTSVDLHYTPTQVVAEFLLKARHLQASVSSESNPNPVQGIMFASSHTGEPNVALNFYHALDKAFADNVQDDWLELIKEEHLPLMP